MRDLSAKELTGVILALLLIGDAIALWAYRRDANTAVLRRLIPSVLTSVGLGALLLAMSTQAQMRRTIGAILLALVLVTLAQRRWGTPQPRPRPAPRHGRASRTRPAPQSV
ncbi:sulfite exporter TauE/SafE domain protein [Actinomyces sp. ICM58]|uniref:TSUP family transporter n=1 Tax=Actinomyces sp. ICM58 TaxID=1105030 RepID=UPI0002772469|nr:TSUP family transporter [Actinomyces sp. ICM58]EJN51189.1 sulfite exporter TauE/SafE domain protein [Actinomyces sp. ICM58]